MSEAFDWTVSSNSYVGNQILPTARFQTKPAHLLPHHLRQDFRPKPRFHRGGFGLVRSVKFP